MKRNRSKAIENKNEEIILNEEQLRATSLLETKIRRPYTLIILPAILISIVFLIPFLWGLYLTFTRYKLSDPTLSFNWGLNYWNMVKSVKFWKSILATFQYTFFCVSIQTILGFFIAILLNTETIMAKIMRKIIVIPLMIAPIIGTIMLNLMMQNKFGIFNYLLSFIGLRDFPWGASASTAMLTVVLVDVWIFTPFMVLIMLAGIRGLPKDPFEAARVDGARGITVLIHMTFPMVLPTFLVAVIFRIIDSLKAFDIIFGMTAGGPGDTTSVFSVFGYLLTFTALDVSRGTTLMIIAWLIIFLISRKLVQYWEITRSRL